MKTCPTCGNSYRPDIEVCPNDGADLTVGTGAPVRTAPPPVAADGPPTARKVVAPRASYSADNFSAGLRESSTASSWVFALVACGLLIGGYFIAREFLLAKSAPPETVVADDGSTAKKKTKKKRSRKRSNRPRTAADGEANFDDYDWEQDYADDDLVLGDIAAQRDVVYEDAPPPRPPEPYDPKPNEWQAAGNYRPTAAWSEPGAKNNAVEIDLTAPSDASPLDEGQVKSVLSVRKLASCYDPWVQKIPQMRGRVHLTLVVAGDGHVASVEVTRSQLRSRVVEECIVKKARTFRFPAAQGGAKTRFDTHFDFTNR